MVAAVVDVIAVVYNFKYAVILGRSAVRSMLLAVRD
jgi:hypothetical protein